MRTIELKQRFFLAGRGLLWLVGTIAILGGLRREPMPMNAMVTLGLAVWVEFLVVLFRIPGLSRWRDPSLPWRDRLCWIPVLLVAMPLSGRACAVYVGLLLVFEILRHVLGQKFSPVSFRNRVMKNPASFHFDESDGFLTLQHVRRSRNQAGKTRMECRYRIEFAEKQKTVGVHIPFWPGFEAPPRIETRLESGPEARVTIRPPQTFGVRIDVRRDGEEPAAVYLQVTIEESANCASDKKVAVLTKLDGLNHLQILPDDQ